MCPTSKNTYLCPSHTTKTHKLSTVSFNCQTFRSNKWLIHKLMEKCDITVIQETLITNYNSNELDLISEGNIAITFMLAKQCANLTGGRPSGGFAIFLRSVNNLTWETIRYTGRIIGLILETNYIQYFILNVYMNCDCRKLGIIHEYQSCVSYISNFTSE